MVFDASMIVEIKDEVNFAQVHKNRKRAMIKVMIARAMK